MSVPLISILIPFHSTARHDRTEMLRELLASIPDRSDVEVVVIDDFSETPLPEGTLFRKAALHFGETTGSARYAGAARNRAVEMAQGRFVIFADSDDLFVTQAFSTVLDELAKSKDRSGIVHVVGTCEFDDLDPDMENTSLYRSVMDGEKSDVTRLLAQWHSPWGKIVNKQLFDRVDLSFDENQRVANDVMFSTKLALAADAMCIYDFPVYRVRRSHQAGALTGRSDAASIRSRFDVVRRRNRLLMERGRQDLVVPMHHAFRAFFRKAPITVLREVARSLVRRDRIFPHDFGFRMGIARED